MSISTPYPCRTRRQTEVVVMRIPLSSVEKKTRGCIVLLCVYALPGGMPGTTRARLRLIKHETGWAIILSGLAGFAPCTLVSLARGR